MPGFQVGVVIGWESDTVRVLINTRRYAPSLGDILYVSEVKENSYTRTVLMEIVGFEGGLPPYASIPLGQTQAQFYRAEEEVVARARLFIEIVNTSGRKYLSKASRPPALLSPVYLLRAGDRESEEIMKDLTEYTGLEGITVAMLRSGIAHSEVHAKERHFENAYFRLDLKKLIPKHVLVTGQTGSGKTSGLMGLILKYALETREPVGWLIIDRHGEYTPREGYVDDKFIGLLVKAVISNHSIRDSVRIKTYRLTYTTCSDAGKLSTYPPYFDIIEAPISASSVTLADFATLEDIRQELVAELEEFIITIMPVLNEMVEQGRKVEVAPTHGKILKRAIFHTDFIRGESPETATANMLALIPILVDNVIRYEGVGLRREEKSGLHRVLVDRGIDARVSRILRREVITKLGWRTKPKQVGNRVLYVVDDTRSVIKVPDILKNPEELACFLEEFMKAFKTTYSSSRVSQSNYPWYGVCKDTATLEVRKEPGVDIDSIVKHVSEGNIGILDTSNVDNVQGDLVAITVTRRIFEHRLEVGVEGSSRIPTVGIVSEEAPLYLSPERVSTPFNSFARIAREGRKFGVGLIAITQMATLIEKQILANFNTMIVLRTRSRSDLGFFGDIGIPVETLPYLGDREAFLYTPDLPIKEPIPVYLPGWFEYKKLVEEKAGSELRAMAKSIREFVELLGDANENSRRLHEEH